MVRKVVGIIFLIVGFAFFAESLILGVIFIIFGILFLILKSNTDSSSLDDTLFDDDYEFNDIGDDFGGDGGSD